MERDFLPTPPLLVWRPGHGEPTRLQASSCGGVEQPVLSSSRLAFDCNNTYFDEIEQSLWVFDLRTRVPREVFDSHGGFAGNDPRGTYLDNIVGGDGLLAFGSERLNARGNVRQRTLWRIDGFDSLALRTSREAGNVVAAGSGRLAVELADRRVAILRTDGTLLRILSPARRRSLLTILFGKDPRPPFRLVGRDLLLLEHGRLQAYDVATGKLRWERRVPARAQLEAAEGGFVVYTAGSSVHVLSHGREKVIQTGGRRLRRLRGLVQNLVHAALTPGGLYYSFNVADRRYPGRVVFVPRKAILSRSPIRPTRSAR
jgi:hypothetical protein